LFNDLEEKKMNIFKKQLFKMPSWMKPELNTIIYWVHLGVLAFVVLGILQLTTGGNMLTIKSVLWSIPLLAIGDFVSHTILGLD